MIPYGRQEITLEDIDTIIQVLRSDFLTQGPMVPLFEKSLSDYCGARYSIAVNSATSALHIACLALNLGRGDWLWTSPITFVASANCGLYCGAQIDFVDIDRKTFNICPTALKNKLSLAKKNNKLPKVVVVVHLCGQPCDMKAINELANEYGFKVIEDASHAIGSKYHDRFTGNGEYSDITIFSFHPVKIITTAEGGAAVTNHSQYAERMELFRSHGITRDPRKMTQVPDGPWFYQQIALGYNYRMSELHAALGVSQLQRLEQYVARRRELAERYNRLLDYLPVITPYQMENAQSSFHLYVIRIILSGSNEKRKLVFNKLRSCGIGVNVHYIPVYRQPWYEQMGFNFRDFPESESYYSEAISLPLYPSMTEQQQDYIVDELRKALV